MMNWAGHFDKIFLINLPHRKDRLAAASEQMLSNGIIHFKIFPAIEAEPGAKGLWLTLKNILSLSIENTYRRIIVFEDDFVFINDPNYYFEWMLDQLEETDKYWEMFYLGANTHEPLNKVNHNILVAKDCLGLHAVCYQGPGIVKALAHMNFFHRSFPADVLFANKIQPDGHCYCAYPMLATQRSGYSDIEKKHIDNSYIQKRFENNTQHLV